MSQMSQKIMNLEKMSGANKAMLVSAIRAVDALEAWAGLKILFDPVCDWNKEGHKPDVTCKILEEWPDHSGSSFHWTLFQIDYIAKNGIDAYVQLIEI